MSGVEDTVKAIITNATTTANTARDKAIEYSNQAQTAAEGILVDLGRIHDPTKPNVTIPPFNPQEDLSGLFSNAVGNTDTQFRQDFTDRVNDFLNTWFPDFANCLKTTVDGWICSTIAGGVTGIPNAIESQIWERSRNQETKEAARLKSEATEALANRGFSLPSGVLYAQLAMIDQAAADKSSTHNRDVAIKQVDIDLTIEGHTVESFARHIEARVNAAVAAAEGMGKIAGAALSAQNTLAEISSQTIT